MQDEVKTTTWHPIWQPVPQFQNRHLFIDVEITNAKKKKHGQLLIPFMEVLPSGTKRGIKINAQK